LELHMVDHRLVGLTVAAVLALVPVASSPVDPDTRAARSIRDPIAQSVILEGHLTTSTRLVIRYVVAGNTAVYSSPSTGEPMLAEGGELGSISIFVDGRIAGGSDAGYVTCAADAPVREYYDQFPTRTIRVVARDRHRVRVVARYCTPDGTESTSTQRIVVR
jgi:hypothetical protein